MEEKRVTAALEVKDGGDEGSVQAAFSVFNVIDSDGDVVLSTAFEDGQAVPMVWSHQWVNPVGKGNVRVEKERAVFDGHFFLDTQAGAEAYKTVKNMAELQEWSFGFRVIEAEDGEHEGTEGVRFLKKLQLFEVSPVLVGANRETETLTIKGPEGKGAIAPHSTPKDEEATWDGPVEVRRMPNSAGVLRGKHAWVKGGISAEDADKKQHYKFPHHPADRPHAIRAAVNNAKQEATALFMWLGYLEANYDEDTVRDVKARLPQANIPAADRAGVLRHLNGHFSSERGHEIPGGKQPGDWQEEADRDLDEALGREAERAGVETA